tara:strand:+ start:7284 stop:7901 length:618 start_codon:yes stop_codon:yes gene_type:complete
MKQTEKDFLNLAIQLEALLFGEFILKSGMKSSYFFNISSFFNLGHLDELAALYYKEINDSGLSFDILFGPAYKGIPLAAAISSLAGAKDEKAFPIAFDRKEIKDHGEGGSIVGEIENKNILIIDDVLTAGTALKNSIDIINSAGGKVVGAMVALDREEKIGNETIKESLEKELNIPILSVAKMSNLIKYIKESKEYSHFSKFFEE